MNFLRQGCQKLEYYCDRQTERQTDATKTLPRHIADSSNNA